MCFSFFLLSAVPWCADGHGESEGNFLFNTACILFLRRMYFIFFLLSAGPDVPTDTVYVFFFFLFFTPRFRPCLSPCAPMQKKTQKQNANLVLAQQHAFEDRSSHVSIQWWWCDVFYLFLQKQQLVLYLVVAQQHAFQAQLLTGQST